MLLEEDLKFLLQNEYLRNSLLLSLSLQLKLLFFFVLRNSHYLILFRNYTLVKTNVSTDFFLKVIYYFILCIKIKTICLCTV
jgi:hypothetical protein